jgi:hypothetical protein
VANNYGPLTADGAVRPTAGDDPYHGLNFPMKWEDAAGVQGLRATFTAAKLTKNVESNGVNYSYFATGVLGKSLPTPRMFTLGLKYSFWFSGRGLG